MKNIAIIFRLILGLLFAVGCQSPQAAKKAVKEARKEERANAVLDQQASDIVQSDETKNASDDFEWGKKHGLGSF